LCCSGWSSCSSGSGWATSARRGATCKAFVALDATKSKWCTADIEPGQVDDEDVVEIATSQRVAE
jgi:large conductance mechanosensitive channel